ncbi:DUF3019 domain-containing protein [Thalassotalea fusca]
MFISRLYALLIFIAVLYPFTSHSLSSSAPATMDIKPVTCMVQEIGQPCTMTIKIKWQTNEPQDVCLRQGVTKLSCWDNQHHIDTQMQVTLEDSMMFTLVNASGEALASQKIDINASNHHAYRRKLKSDWSLF